MRGGDDEEECAVDELNELNELELPLLLLLLFLLLDAVANDSEVFGRATAEEENCEDSVSLLDDGCV